MATQAPTRAQRLGPPLLIVVMLAVGLSLCLPRLAESSATVVSPRIPLLALAAVWLVLELVTLYVSFGGDLDNSEDIVLTEFVLALGLLMATPLDLLVVGFTVPVLVHLVQRRKSPLKQLFNAANRTIELGVGLAVYQAVRPEDPLSMTGWAAVVLAVVASGTASGLTVSTVISLAIGRLPIGDFARSTLFPVPVSVACGSAAFVVAAALASDALSTLPALVVVFGSGVLLVRTLSVLTERHMDLRSLHGFGQRLDDVGEPAEIVASALEAATDLLVARTAEAYVRDPDDPDGFQRVSRGPDGALSRVPVPREELPDDHGVAGDRSRVSTATGTGDDLLVLSTHDRGTGIRPFTAQDLRLLDMVAHQAGSHLATSRLIARLRHEALHDKLTGLANRARLLEVAREQLASAPGSSTALVWIGLEGLDTVNAALGHDRGDELLVQVGRRLKEHAPAGATVARVGSDEFAVLLHADPVREADPDRPGAPAQLCALPLVDVLRGPFLLFDVEVLVRGRAGVCQASAWSPLTAEELLRRADVAMREARRRGLDVEEHTALLETATPATLALAAELRGAIDGEELVLHAQPQLRLDDGRVSGVEMLVRWQHPRLGLLPPNAFLPLAEQTGLDRPLTLWVLDRALAAAAAWRCDDIELEVSVNVSPTMLADHELGEQVRELLAKHALPGGGVVLEITESSLITSPVQAAALLEQLAALGVRISIDDFGTGFSSLSYLRRLPVHEIKVDKTFVLGMLDSDDDAAVVRSVVGLGQSLGLRVVAEGVENRATLEILRDLRCEAAQGYHLARPMPLAEIPGWLRSRALGALSGPA